MQWWQTTAIDPWIFAIEFKYFRVLHLKALPQEVITKYNRVARKYLNETHIILTRIDGMSMRSRRTFVYG